MSSSRRYPPRPILGVGALILDGDRICLVRRAKPPQEGWWSLPGGAVETGERVEDALRREVWEETGLHVESMQLIEIFERITRDPEGVVEFHYVLLDYLCHVAPSPPRAGSDSLETRWFHRRELGNLPITEGTLEIVEKTFDRHGAK